MLSFFPANYWINLVMIQILQIFKQFKPCPNSTTYTFFLLKMLNASFTKNWNKVPSIQSLLSYFAVSPKYQPKCILWITFFCTNSNHSSKRSSTWRIKYKVFVIRALSMGRQIPAFLGQGGRLTFACSHHCLCTIYYTVISCKTRECLQQKPEPKTQLPSHKPKK